MLVNSSYISLAGDLATKERLLTVFFLALLVPTIHLSRKRSRIAACSDNLRGMWEMMRIYQSQFGGGERKMPTKVGRAFWLAVEDVKPPMTDWIDYKNFSCPVKEGGIIGDLDYWGPGRPVSELGDMEPVGCDAMGEAPNHGGDGCNLLRKSGDVIEISVLECWIMLQSYWMKALIT